MTRYTEASRRAGPSAQPQVPAIWRGIGCLLILIVPLMSYAIAVLTVQAATEKNWPIPYQLVGFPVLPPSLLKVGALAPIWNFIQAQPNLYGIVVFTILFIVVIGAVLSFGYALLYRFVGPPRLGPLDAEQPRIAVKRYKR
jgi:hypothetical protein